MTTAPPPAEPFLRTLAPMLRGLERRLRGWLDGPHPVPLPLVGRAEAEGLTDDLRRKADDLGVDRPLLVVMLMGGTGVGKSTLLNALAGAAVAQASFTRPTTRDPVVYFHQSVTPDRLDPALRMCRLAPHDRDALAQKVLVDTPDLDSNDLANREKLLALLPVADVVLYVGSQEKYHDQLGWELFKEQRVRRAFGFVLNKWDRCYQPGESGVRPDEDLLRDLEAEGFRSPKLFRVTAQAWLDAEANGETVPEGLPPGEQFAELRDWLEQGLTRVEIEAVKARGVGQLLAQVERAVGAARPADLSREAEGVQRVWAETLDGEAGVQAEVLVGTLEPLRQEVEHHFSVRGQQRFRGLMAGYLRLTTKLRYAGGALRPRIPLPSVTGRSAARSPESEEWDVAGFVHDCARTAGDRVLDQRNVALANKLLVDADRAGMPIALLSDRTTTAAERDWDDRLTRALSETLTEVEAESTRPTGWRKLVRGPVVVLANFLPEVVLVGSVVMLMLNFFVFSQTPSLWQMLLPIYLTVITLVLFHVLVSVTALVRWPAIRGEFQKRLEAKLREEMRRVYLPLPVAVAVDVDREREAVEGLVAETREVAGWLRDRESAAKVGELYGG